MFICRNVCQVMDNSRRSLAIAMGVLALLTGPMSAAAFAAPLPAGSKPAEATPAGPIPAEPKSAEPVAAEPKPSEPKPAEPAATEQVPVPNKGETPPAAQTPAQPTEPASAPITQGEPVTGTKPDASPIKTTTSTQWAPSTPAPTPQINEAPIVKNRNLKGYQLVPGETGASDRPPPRNCGRGYTAGVLPFGDRPLGPRGRLEAEVGLSAHSGDDDSQFWLSPLLRGQYRVLDTVAVTADWGFSYMNSSPEDGNSKNRFRPGNPFIAVHSARRHGCTELRVGLGATIPLASLTERDQYNVFPVYYGAMAIRGMSEYWLWFPNAMTVALPVSWETVLSDDWLWGGSVVLVGSAVFSEAAPAETLRFLTEKPRRSHLVVPVSLHAGYHLGPAIVGAYVHSIFIVTGDGDKQLSFTPFTKLGLGAGYLEARLTINIDKPLGLSFSKDGYWGVQLGGGYGF